VIDSSVAGIVSANLRGVVLLFNRAAARIFGVTAERSRRQDARRKLYPPGRRARYHAQNSADPSVSGYGRLEDQRVDMLTSAGRSDQVQSRRRS